LKEFDQIKKTQQRQPESWQNNSGNKKETLIKKCEPNNIKFRYGKKINSPHKMGR
jgi:hypothetical protein